MKSVSNSHHFGWKNHGLLTGNEKLVLIVFVLDKGPFLFQKSSIFNGKSAAYNSKLQMNGELDRTSNSNK